MPIDQMKLEGNNEYYPRIDLTIRTHSPLFSIIYLKQPRIKKCDLNGKIETLGKEIYFNLLKHLKSTQRYWEGSAAGFTPPLANVPISSVATK